MPTYAVNYYTPEGKYRKRIVDAASADEASHVIRAEGGHPVTAAPAKRRTKAEHIKLSVREQIELFEHLELHLQGGILVDEALNEIRKAASQKRVRLVADEMFRVLVQAKASLASAMAMFPRSFPPAVVSVVHAGEGSGIDALAESFADLRDRLEYDEAKRAEIKRGLSYPAFLMAGAGGLVVLLMTYFVPRVEALLKEANAPMPEITLRVIGTANFMIAHWKALASLLFIPLAIRYARRIPGVAMVLDGIFLRTPYFGSIYRALATAQVAKYYFTLRKSGGRSAGEILQLCEGLFGNLAMRAAIARIRERVTTGKLELWQACSRETIFPPSAVALIKTGERSGQLERAFASIAKFNAEAARKRIDRTLRWMVPVVTVITALIIFTILFALFSPIFSLLGNFNP